MLSLVLVGCQSMPPLNFSVPNVGYSERKIDAELRSLTVSLARPDETKGKMPADAVGVPNLWAASLQEALNRMVIFKDDAAKKINLAVKILALDIPGSGFSMTTTSIARYEIIDRANGDIIHTQDISAQGVVPVDYAFLGAVRAVESINRSVQNNIALFLQSLETIDINRPMFPTYAVSK